MYVSEKKRTMPIVFFRVNKFMGNSQKTSRMILLFVAAIAAVSGIIASLHFRNKAETPAYQSLLLYPEAKSIHSFELINQNNEKVTNESIKGEWTMLFFGYTHCPDICPTTLTELKKVFNLLKDSPKPKVLFVSVDPERDNTQILKDYITFFNPDFNAATASKEQIKDLAAQVGVAYYISDHKPGDLNYAVDHTAAIFLMNPEAKLKGIFRSPHEADKIAADLKALLEK